MVYGIPTKPSGGQKSRAVMLQPRFTPRTRRNCLAAAFVSRKESLKIESAKPTNTPSTHSVGSAIVPNLLSKLRIHQSVKIITIEATTLFLFCDFIIINVKAHLPPNPKAIKAEITLRLRNFKWINVIY